MEKITDFYQVYLENKEQFEIIKNLFKIEIDINRNRSFLLSYQENFEIIKNSNYTGNLLLIFKLYELVFSVVNNTKKEFKQKINEIEGYSKYDLIKKLIKKIKFCENNYEVIVGGYDVINNKENKIYEQVSFWNKGKVFFTNKMTKEEVIKKINSKSTTTIAIISHGNNLNGIKIYSDNGNFELNADEFCPINKNLNLLLLSCASSYFEELNCFNRFNNIVLDNNSIGPTEQEAFLSFFLKAIDFSLSFESAFIIAEIGMSSYFDTLKGTVLYNEGRIIHRLN